MFYLTVRQDQVKYIFGDKKPYYTIIHCPGKNTRVKCIMVAAYTVCIVQFNNESNMETP